MPTQHPSPPIGKRYVTIKQALQLYDVSDKTIERYIHQKVLPIVRDRFKHVKIDLDVLEQVMREREKPPNPIMQQLEVHQRQIDELEREVQALREQLEQMTAQLNAQSLVLTALKTSAGGDLSVEQAAVLLKQQVAQALADTGSERIRKIATPRQPTALEKRGLPDGTMKLVDFITAHHLSLSPWHFKKACAAGEIALTIYQREGEAKRNKREWWITPPQHRALISYCRQRQIMYTPCSGCTDQNEEQQAG